MGLTCLLRTVCSCRHNHECLTYVMRARGNGQIPAAAGTGGPNDWGESFHAEGRAILNQPEPDS